jgi:hypothetical protein
LLFLSRVAGAVLLLCPPPGGRTCGWSITRMVRIGKWISGSFLWLPRTRKFGLTLGSFGCRGRRLGRWCWRGLGRLWRCVGSLLKTRLSSYAAVPTNYGPVKMKLVKKCRL